MTPRTLHWFRHDLRLADNPALTKAASEGLVTPIFILDDEAAGDDRLGGATRVWLHHALKSLNVSVENNLIVMSGDAETCLHRIIEQTGATILTFTTSYAPWQVKQDAQITKQLLEQGVTVIQESGSVLWEPEQVQKADGTPYRVFTPFYRRGCLNLTQPRFPLAPPDITFAEPVQACPSGALAIDSLNLLPEHPWGDEICAGWDISEAGAHERLAEFVDDGLSNYKEGRNFPDKPHVSRLSPYMRFGQVSAHQAWYAADGILPEHDSQRETFRSELGWREFSHNLVMQNPDIRTKNIQTKFDTFGWRDDNAALTSWQTGMTGFPIVDAGMRELYQTGYMHNRVRMIVGSFLVKNLLLDWRHGERWFWDCLFDADFANNRAGWQWIAGCGADAAPYFRVFNPVTQGQKFDADGHYTRKYVPELSKLPSKYLFAPWEAPSTILQHAGVTLGTTYPKPIVDLKASRLRALDAFADLKLAANAAVEEQI